MKIQIINGPNLNMLGVREPEVYGKMTLAELNGSIAAEADSMGISTDFYQSNHEGEIIDKIQQCYKKCDGIIINPGAYTHYSYAIRDAISAVDIFTVEVHLSDIHNREYFRKTSVIEEVVKKQFYGKGLASYIEALHYLAGKLKQNRQ
jgi:3-dehydroquinate dehydratase-2